MHIPWPSDHAGRSAWMGPSFPLYLEVLPVRSEEIPLQYPSLRALPAPTSRQAAADQSLRISTGLGYSSTRPQPSIEERKKAGAQIEQILRGEKEAARAPTD